MKKYTAWIVYNGNLNIDKFTSQVQHFKDVAEKEGIEAEMVKNNELLTAVKNGEAVIEGKYKNAHPDFVIFWDKDIALARHLEKTGMRLYNNSKAIEICDDKGLTYEVLSNNHIKMPDTIIAPKVYIKVEDFSTYDYIISFLGFPMIIKECFGSFGAQVYMINNRTELINKIQELGNKPYVFQKFINSSYGKDIRLNVVGGQVVAAMLRTSEDDFRANISAGGRMQHYDPTEAEKALAIKCCELTGSAFAGVDLLFGPNGEPIVCEINSNAHMKNIYDCTGVDVAEHILKYIINDMEVEK
ncbi:ATP-grasp domain-containing protein [Clostridium oryzae]|uniref:Ribosomal protein S6--L-glutamate ligase n=1 Tax=Clostridium oryzae TaxID=1450648 RepID=A0A1V4IR62_9CLOT|nr:RimK family alpha-L-glutamate ligase [Clostridium oryzae]OPJ62403.1 ribosomal protein S6--L-glutamate ligase [Clostridium oryzae]